MRGPLSLLILFPYTDLMIDVRDIQSALEEYLAQHEELSLSDLSSRIGEPVSMVSAMLFGLELDGQIRSLPGGRYRLIRR